MESRELPAIIVNVDAAADRHAISPLIYGLAFADTAALNGLNVPYNRSGGNTTTRYNWQQNASNRANDWFYQSIADGPATPGAAADGFVQATRAAGASATLTIPTLGWVAKLGPNRAKLASYSIAKYGAQTGNDWQWYPDAGNGIRASDGTPITTNNPNDANVPADANFQRAWVQHLVSTWGTSAAGGLRFYTLDNEPSLWHSTHRDVHPNGASMDEIFNNIVNYSAMIKAADPGALSIGPEEWGWSGYFYSGKDQQYGSQTGDWGHLPDRAAHGGADYMPWLLQQLRAYDVAHGTHSLDVFSLHYYPQGGEFSDTVTNSMQLLRNRSTRSLWDPAYVDQSWIGQAGPDSGIVRLIPRMEQWLNTYYPGLQTGITEYNWGAEGHMNGATTQADILGIFGREGLDLANRWTTPAAGTPAYLAIKMYRNYDGNKSTFGDTGVRATVPNPDQVSVFASQRADGTMTVMVINKNLYDPANAGATTQITVNLNNFANRGTAQLWRLAATNPANQTVATIARQADVTFSANSFTFNAPMQSVQLFVIPPGDVATTTTLTSSGNPSAAGEAVTFSATVSAAASTPAGTVTFRDGTTTLGTAAVGSGGVATFTTTSLVAGSHSITAIYGGAAGFAASTSVAANQTVVTRPSVTGVQIGDGSVQRSLVRSIAVTFGGLVALDPGAFVVTRGDGLGTTVGFTSAVVSGRTVATLTFSGAGAESSGSLADGLWSVKVFAAKVHDASHATITMAADQTTAFHRFFGDVNGDRFVNGADFALFRTAFGTTAGDPNYNPLFDFNGDGFINGLDFGEFRTRFGLSL